MEVDEWVMSLANIMGCKVGSLLANYLGLPLCAGCSSKAPWNLVVESGTSASNLEIGMSASGGKGHPYSGNAF